jgi:hypothetical protein
MVLPSRFFSPAFGSGIAKNGARTTLSKIEK